CSFRHTLTEVSPEDVIKAPTRSPQCGKSAGPPRTSHPTSEMRAPPNSHRIAWKRRPQPWLAHRDAAAPGREILDIADRLTCSGVTDTDNSPDHVSGRTGSFRPELCLPREF